MLRIAVYGKGGIGKSTTVSNIAATLALRGLTVMQIGCDPKADSTYLLMHGMRIPTVLDLMRHGDELNLKDMVFEGFAGVACVEAGGPMPGSGCAGRGIISAFEKLDDLAAYKIYQPDVVLYDVLGDVVCGGFSMPLRGEYSDIVYVVTSGEMMSMYAASNIASAIERFKTRGYARLGGLILNRRAVPDEETLVRNLAYELHTSLVADIPRSPDIQACEQRKCTVIEGAPHSAAATAYKTFANVIAQEMKVTTDTLKEQVPNDDYPL